MAGIDLESVVKQYDNGFRAVKGINLSIADGEFLVLVGPSGCGKSTTLRMIAGLEEISDGTISIGGRVVNSVHPKDRDIAMVFQNYALYPHMTVEKNMAFSLKLRGTPKAEIDRRVQEAAEMLGLTELLSRKPKRLSGGQRQRVALGRAVVREPKAFLFDEPLSNLDAKLRTTTRGELKALHQRLKTTTVYVTHDQEEAMTLGDRIVVMKEGEIQQADTPFEVYTNPANLFVAQFIGTPPMNIIPGRLERGSFIEDGTSDPLPTSGPIADLEDSQVNLGVRPQHLRELEKDDPTPSFTLIPEVVEPLGDLMDVSGRSPGGRRVVARIPAHAKLPIGKPARFAIEFDRCHAFEHLGTGKNLTLAQPALA